MIVNERDQEIASEIGKRICAARQAKGFSQYKLADLLGVRQPMIAAYESGRRMVSIRRLMELTELLGLSSDSILGLMIKDGRTAKPGPRSRLETLFEEIQQLPESEKQYIATFFEKTLAAAEHGKTG